MITITEKKVVGEIFATRVSGEESSVAQVNVPGYSTPIATGFYAVDHINDVSGVSSDGANSEVVYRGSTTRAGTSSGKVRFKDTAQSLAIAFKQAGFDVPVKTPLTVQGRRLIQALRNH